MQREPSKLKKFSVISYFLLDEPIWFGNAHNIYQFLESFSGLEDLEIAVCSDWMIDVRKILYRHHTLESLTIRCGECDFVTSSIATVAELCPDLKTLGIRYSPASLLIQEGKFSKNFKKKMQALAKEVAKFKQWRS